MNPTNRIHLRYRTSPKEAWALLSSSADNDYNRDYTQRVAKDYHESHPDWEIEIVRDIVTTIVHQHFGPYLDPKTKPPPAAACGFAG